MASDAGEVNLFFGTAYDEGDARSGYSDEPMLAAIYVDGTGTSHVLAKFRFYDAYTVVNGLECRAMTGGSEIFKWSIETDGTPTGALATKIAAISAQNVTTARLEKTDAASKKIVVEALEKNNRKLIEFRYDDPVTPANNRIALSFDTTLDIFTPYTGQGYQYGNKTVLGSATASFAKGYIVELEGRDPATNNPKWGISASGDFLWDAFQHNLRKWAFIPDAAYRTNYLGGYTPAIGDIMYAYPGHPSYALPIQIPTADSSGQEYLLWSIKGGIPMWKKKEEVGGGGGEAGQLTFTQNNRTTIVRLENSGDGIHADLVMLDDRSEEVMRISGFDGTISVGNSEVGSPDVIKIKPPDNCDSEDWVIETNAWKIRKDGIMAGVKIGFKKG
jgi:hypothetical protein